MRLIEARIRYYRSIVDTGYFEIEADKTILVGPNEAGKTVILQALQKLNPPKGLGGFNLLRDYPRSKYNRDIERGSVDPAKETAVEGTFQLEPRDLEGLPVEFHESTYTLGRLLDNSTWHRINGGPSIPKFGELKRDIKRLAAHVDKRAESDTPLPSAALEDFTAPWNDDTLISGTPAENLRTWLEKIYPLTEEGSAEEQRYERLLRATEISSLRERALELLHRRVPIFVLYNNYFRVRPRIHLSHLAEREESGNLDETQFDYGNLCLLKLLGFSAKELSELGAASAPRMGDRDALARYQERRDEREYKLNSASVRLTSEITGAWNPDPSRPEASKLRIKADGQYRKVVVEDELGVEIELDQRSEGFQWLVSFFTVFFAEAEDKHRNAILLLDEPGLQLHGLKQREFRETISQLAKKNQAVYTTHSPFLVGPDELDIVRVVDMLDRSEGTKVHSNLSSGDPAALLPLQEALGYDLAQSLFSQTRNLLLEGITDFWYVSSVAHMLRESGEANLNEKIALIFAGGASKLVYYATILHAHKLKVAAVLDSDAAGDQAASQEALIHTLGNKKILRTIDHYKGDVTRPEIEDLMRETLVTVAKDLLGWDASEKAAKQPKRPIIELLSAELTGFSKYKLAKAFLRWSQAHDASDLTQQERENWTSLISTINSALK